jgi:hypothetical protein
MIEACCSKTEGLLSSWRSRGLATGDGIITVSGCRENILRALKYYQFDQFVGLRCL